jgi:hypothetical protein
VIISSISVACLWAWKLGKLVSLRAPYARH